MFRVPVVIRESTPLVHIPHQLAIKQQKRIIFSLLRQRTPEIEEENADVQPFPTGAAQSECFSIRLQQLPQYNAAFTGGEVRRILVVAG